GQGSLPLAPEVLASRDDDPGEGQQGRDPRRGAGPGEPQPPPALSRAVFGPPGLHAMPIEIRRFGVGHRRADGPPGTTGVAGQVIHSDARGSISEMAFARGAAIEPHSNPNPSWFIVI